MKTVRLPLAGIDKLLARADLIDLKVVLLVRDPRAIINSRRRMQWCTDPVCSSPKVLCRMMVDNYDGIERMQQQYPHRFTVLR